MKIIFVYDAAYPYVLGGAEKRIYETGRRLAAKGHEIHWYTMKWWQGEDTIKKEGIILHGIGKPLPLYKKTGRRSIREAIWYSIKILLALRREDFDLIDCQNFPYLPCFSCKIISSIKKKPLVITWHEVWGGYWHKYLGLAGLLGELAEKICFRLTKNNISVSVKTKQMLESVGVGENRITVVPNGIDFEAIQSIKKKEKGFDVLYAGRLIKEKNVSMLLESIKKITETNPDIRLGIIGDGPEKNNLVELTKKLGIENNVAFLGFFEDSQEVIAYMKASKTLVLPSTREGFGIVALEANASGIPVVTIRHEMNAAADLVEEGINGFLCDYSKDGLTQAINKALTSYQDMRDACLNKSKEYSWDKITTQLEKYYENIADPC